MNLNYVAAGIFCTIGLEASERPNIIIFLTDDQSMSSIASLGNPELKTPNLDRLVNNGVAFMRHYATTSISMPSRATVMTGKYEYKTGCNFMKGCLPAEKFETSYPILLREAGYYTGFGGKFGFAIRENEEEGLDESYHTYDVLPVDEFDEWAGGPGQTNYATKKNQYIKQYADKHAHSSAAYGAFGVDFLDRAKETGKPFCLSISFKAPHLPFTPDKNYDHVYADTYFPDPKNYTEECKDLLPTQAKLGRQYLNMFDNVYEQKRQETYRKYHQLIHGVDQAIGRIVDHLEETGLADNTIIIFTSDNGYALGSRRVGGKVLPYECSSRIPLIIVDPRQEKSAGKKVTALSGNIDIAPTILDYANVDAPNNMDGQSLRAAMQNPNIDEIHSELALINGWGSAQHFSLAVVSDGYKYIYWPFAEGMEASEELYNLNEDPYEQLNLVEVKDSKKQLDKMRKKYDEQLVKWEKECVQNRSYHLYPQILSRTVAWEDKKDLIPVGHFKVFDTYLEKMNYEGDPTDYNAIIQAAQP